MTGRHARSRAAILASFLAVLIAACASSSPTPSPSPDAAATDPASPDARALGRFAGVPIACVGLGDADCQRVLDHAAALVTDADPPVVYVQVGPFGCTETIPCPTTLAARPEGDTTVEFADGTATAVHAKAVPDGSLAVTRQEAMGIAVAPASPKTGVIGPQPFTLGHCGLWSGIDLDGSLWAPVGRVDYDHTDAINSAEGTFAFLDPDHGTFASKGGLNVQLVRHPGSMFLPLCA